MAEVQVEVNDSDTESTTQNCSSCFNSLTHEKIYRCTTCVSQNDEDFVDQVPLQEPFCEMCIVHLHHRKKHDIIDYRSYEPPICPTHKFICVFFCETCLLIFCRLCTEKHCSHNFTLIKSKALEVRKQIFDALTENETLANSLLGLKNCCSAINIFFKSLDDNNLTATLTEAYNRVIKKHSDRWGKEILDYHTAAFEAKINNNKKLEKSTQLLKLVDEKINKLRGMLTVSDGRCVEKYLKEGNAMSSSKDDHNPDGMNHFYVEEGKSLDAIVEESNRKCLEKIEFPQLRCKTMKPITFRCLKLNDYDGLSQTLARNNVVQASNSGHSKSPVFSVQPSNSGDSKSTGVLNLKITPTTVSFSVLRKLGATYNEKRLQFNVLNVDSVHRYKNYVLFWRNEGRFSVEDIGTGAEIFSGDVFESRCLDFFISDTQVLHLLYVSQNGDEMFFSTKKLNKKGFWFSKRMKCLRKPKIAAFSLEFVISVSDDYSMQLYGLDCPEYRLKIQCHQLGLFHIDEVSFCAVQKVNIFDYKALVVLTVSLKYTSERVAVEWSIAEVRKIIVPSDSPISFCGYIDDGYLYAVTGKEIHLQNR